MDLDTWACPACFSRLSESGDSLQCADIGHRYRWSSGLPVLLRPEDEGLLQDSLGYAAAWKRDRWAPPTAQLLHLPHVRAGEWKLKARSFEALLTILGPANGRSIADVGAGTGWLSHRLAAVGFRCFATDISPDSRVGLGASVAFDSTPHKFERAVGTLTRWPLRTGAIDVAICNASLHYARDIRPVIEEAARVLRPRGVFIVLNSPIHRNRRSAERAASDFRARLRRAGGTGSVVDGLRHLVAQDLEEALMRSFPSVRRHDPYYGLLFPLSRWAKGFVLRIELASFPIYIAGEG